MSFTKNPKPWQTLDFQIVADNSLDVFFSSLVQLWSHLFEGAMSGLLVWQFTNLHTYSVNGENVTDHQGLAAKTSQSTWTYVLKCPTLKQKKTYLQPGLFIVSKYQIKPHRDA